MGRKIPARRHHGVRDPLVQAAQRLALIKDKINHPPERQDHQEVSNKLADFIRLKDEAKTGKIKRVRDGEDRPENYKSNKASSNATSDAQQPHRHDKALPAIRRLQNEPDEDYLRRVNRITHASIRESQFESKYGVEVIRNERGEITIKKRPVDELGEAMKEARRRQKRQGGNVAADDNEDEVAAKKRKKREAAAAKKLTDAERKVLVKQMMAAKKQAKAVAAEKAVEYKTDVVAFGEVTHGPPQLVTPRRAQKAETVARPGAKKSLLLHSVLDGGAKAGQTKSASSASDATETSAAKKTKAAAPKTSFDLKGKRRELTDGMRQMIEKQQQSVMDMYRELKKKNRLNNIE